MKNERVTYEDIGGYNPQKTVSTGLLLIAGILIVLIFNPVMFIEAGHRGVLLQFGEVISTLPEGLAIKMPVVQRIVIVDVRTQKYEVTSAAASKDLQDVSTIIAVNFHVEPSRAGELLKNVGEGYQDKIIAPAVQESLKQATSMFTAEELITKREQAREKVTIALKERLAQYGLIVETTSIVNFKFSEQFTQSIEAKVTAEQNAFKAKNDLERIKFEAEQKVATAKGEAEALRIQNDELQKSQQVLTLRWIEKWNGVMPKVVAGSSNLMLGIPQELLTNATGMN